MSSPLCKVTNNDSDSYFIKIPASYIQQFTLNVADVSMKLEFLINALIFTTWIRKISIRTVIAKSGILGPVRVIVAD
jgi:hypothetical protein